MRFKIAWIVEAFIQLKKNNKKMVDEMTDILWQSKQLGFLHWSILYSVIEIIINFVYGLRSCRIWTLNITSVAGNKSFYYSRITCDETSISHKKEDRLSSLVSTSIFGTVLFFFKKLLSSFFPKTSFGKDPLVKGNFECWRLQKFSWI